MELKHGRFRVDVRGRREEKLGRAKEERRNRFRWARTWWVKLA